MLATELRSGRRLVACLVATAVLSAGAGSALAVDITVAYTPNFLAGPGAGGPPVGSVGVVEQAAHNWEAAILDPFAVTITFDWGVPDMGSQVCGRRETDGGKCQPHASHSGRSAAQQHTGQLVCGRLAA